NPQPAAAAAVSMPAAAPSFERAAEAAAPAESEDLFGLATIFREESVAYGAGSITEDDVDRIADRVIQRLSTQVIESIAWEIVPDITEKIVREELKRVK